MPKLKQRLIDAIGSHQDDIVRFTKSLVAIPTENPPGRAYRACVDAIAAEVRRIGLDCAVAEIPAERGRGHAETSRYWLRGFHGKGRRRLYFHGHYDVVPASNETQFQPRIERGKLFGRGSADMKSGLAAMIYAISALKELDVPLNGRIGLVCVPDEETGGARGSRYLSDRGLLGANGVGMLTPEPTAGAIWNASRGAISMRVTLKGKPAHVGLSCRGVNAFERMLAVAAALERHEKKIAVRRTAFRVHPEKARGSILLLGGRCEGGTNFNVVPAECSFTVDRRINPEENLEAEKRALMQIFDRFRREGIQLETELIQEGRPAGVSESDLVAQALAQSAQEITGKQPVFEMCPGLLEIRFYAAKGIPAFAYGPGLLTVSHGPHEFVGLKDVFSCAAVYALTAARLLGSRGALKES